MINQIVNNATPVIITAIFAVITVIVKSVADVACECIKTKKQQLITKIGAENYNNYRDIAFDVYYRVEQEFKGQENVAQEKLKAFNQYIFQKIPGITQEQLNHFRESVVGTVNNAIEEKGLLDKVTTLSNSTEVAVDASKTDSQEQSLNNAVQDACVTTGQSQITSEEVLNALNAFGDITKKVAQYITANQK